MILSVTKDVKNYNVAVAQLNQSIVKRYDDLYKSVLNTQKIVDSLQYKVDSLNTTIYEADLVMKEIVELYDYIK